MGCGSDVHTDVVGEVNWFFFSREMKLLMFFLGYSGYLGKY